MGDSTKKTILILLIVTILPLITANYSLDINGLQSESYAVGEELKFNIILLENSNKITGNIEISIYDIRETKTIQKTISSDQQTSIPLEKDFPSGLWTIEASYNNETVERTFTIQEKSSIEFNIEENKLIIKNNGNVRYQKTIQITIGETKQSKTLNIPVNEQKEWELVAPKGVYDIHITDGESTFTKKNIQLFGTGNVIGAIDENLIGYSGFGSAPTSGNIEDRFISLNKVPLALIFVLVVFGLGILIGIERVTKKRK